MAQKVTISNLPQAVAKIVNDYKEGVIEDSRELVRKTAQKGRAAIKVSSANVISAGYASRWRYKVEGGRLNTVAIIYHSPPGLPHLLEHGHAMPNGGRAPARPHIAPVEETLVREFERDMKEVLTK